MKLEETGILVAGEAGTPRACYTFPAIVALDDGTLIATARHGATKDGDDEEIAVFVRRPDQKNWEPYPALPPSPVIDGRSGTLKHAYLTRMADGELIAAAMWVDRTTYPGQPLFNPKTEGCLPMAIVIARSSDRGASWSEWRALDLPDELGPPSLTSPLIALPDGSLAMSIETNKTYLDDGPWPQRAVMLHSADRGETWSAPIVSARDPTGQVFNWDLRVAADPQGHMVSFAWTFDRVATAYRDIHRRISSDGGASWTERVDMGVTDQPGRPSILPDGRVILPFVDRFGSRTIRARLADGLDAPLREESDIVLYAHQPEAPDGPAGNTLAGALSEMELWSFGLPFATAISEKKAIVAWYGGTADRMDIHWAALTL